MAHSQDEATGRATQRTRASAKGRNCLVATLPVPSQWPQLSQPAFLYLLYNDNGGPFHHHERRQRRFRVAFAARTGTYPVDSLPLGVCAVRCTHIRRTYRYDAPPLGVRAIAIWRNEKKPTPHARVVLAEPRKDPHAVLVLRLRYAVARTPGRGGRGGSQA